MAVILYNCFIETGASQIEAVGGRGVPWIDLQNLFEGTKGVLKAACSHESQAHIVLNACIFWLKPDGFLIARQCFAGLSRQVLGQSKPEPGRSVQRSLFRRILESLFGFCVLS